ncbi:MAG TPA: MBL fold metallo-hydrolase [Polyangiales bacterium]|nr:MBL fold metallo-hydrolase [Polyangiales bacterium]
MAGDDIPFVKDMHAEYGVLEEMAPNLRRMIANNPGPFTHAGSGTYVVGRGRVAVIDPGPALPEHIDALLRALGDEQITHILVTHTHADHSPGARLLKAACGAPTYGFGPHAFGRYQRGEIVEAGADLDFVPDHRLADGQVLDTPTFRIGAVHTPGHCSNHLCFALPDTGALLTGDHVMAWSTSIVSPPDGDMAQYMASLSRLLTRSDSIYFPTHGVPIPNPKPFVRAYVRHRQLREAQILDCLSRGMQRIDDMVKVMYVGLPAFLVPAAARSVFAHLLQLLDEGRVRTEGGASLDASYTLA